MPFMHLDKMHECSLGEQLAIAADKDHAEPMGKYQPNRVGMMRQSSLASYSPGLNSCIMTNNGIKT